ncbi:MAG: tyrosine-type recombinase/integrase [Dokdonella sp.]|nr:tyrosine-type recombinase/integrase [Dokdonella sp.]
MPFVALPPGEESFPHYASRAQIVALLNTPMAEHAWAYCLVRLCTGCRGDAALDLQAPQVDRQSNYVRLNPPGRRQTRKYRPTVPLVRPLAAYLDEAQPQGYLVNWHGKQIKSIKTTWRKLRVAAGLPSWFAPRVLRHTVATWLRQRGVPAWDVSGQIGHRAAGTTDGYAKFDPSYLGEARKAIEAFLLDLSKDVPRLRPLCGVSAGSLATQTETARTRESRAVAAFQVVGGTGIEPVTPTMSR